MGTIRKFEDAESWRKARELANYVYKLTQGVKFNKDYVLRDQIRRCAVSVMANIAEGIARRTNKELINFLAIAHGSAAELQSHLVLAMDQGYLTQVEFQKAFDLADESSKMIQGFSNYLNNFQTRNSQLATRNSKGQATTEMVLLVPLFMIFAIGIIKIFALSVMVQRMELAMYYAGRRWMLESHKNAAYASWDQNTLVKDINHYIMNFLGGDDEFKRQFLGFKPQDIKFKVEPTIIYGVLKLNVRTRGLIPFQPDMEKEWEIVKYVPTRDRPIRWNIPSVAVEE